MKKKTKVYVGMDVHKDSVMIAVLPEGVREPTQVKRLSHDPRGLRRLLDRLAREHEVRACSAASGTGYVLERKIRSWGHACEIVAPSLIPRRPGERRKHDRKDAEELARLYRAGELVTIRVPTEREERVRDLVRCRGTFQREILRSRHLHPEVPGPLRSGLPGGQELDDQAHDVAARDSARRGWRPRTKSSSASTWRCWTTRWTAATSSTATSKRWRWSRPTRKRSADCAASRGSRRRQRWCWSPRSGNSDASSTRAR